MSNKKKQDQAELYKRLLHQLSERLDKFEHESVPEALEHVKKTAFLCEEVTEEEAQNIALFIQRDLTDAAYYMHQTGENIKFWWGVDVDYMEDKLWQVFSLVADRYIIDKLVFDRQLQEKRIYRTKEITIGTLQCNRCGHILHLKKVSPIPLCTKCKGRSFSRPHSSKRS